MYEVKSEYEFNHVFNRASEYLPNSADMVTDQQCAKLACLFEAQEYWLYALKMF